MLLIRHIQLSQTYLVLKYLEGMEKAHQSDRETQDDLRSNHSGVSRQSRNARSQNGVLSPRSQSQNGQTLQDLAGSVVSYERLVPDQRLREREDDDDLGSDVQQRSDGGTALPVVCLDGHLLP